jgi:hypothetical protein
MTIEYIIELPLFVQGGEFIAKFPLVLEKEHSAELGGII